MTAAYARTCRMWCARSWPMSGRSGTRRVAYSNGCGSSEGTSGGSGHGAAEIAGLVDSAAFLGEVPCPVRVEVAVAV